MWVRPDADVRWKGQSRTPMASLTSRCNAPSSLTRSLCAYVLGQDHLQRSSGSSRLRTCSWRCQIGCRCGYLSGAVALALSCDLLCVVSPFTPTFVRFHPPTLTHELATCMQGPYLYEVYSRHGYTHQEIMAFMVIGFASSLVLGTMVTGAADVLGRKAICMVSGVLFVASCGAMHFTSRAVLVFGRAASGAATTILMTAFETWMMHEHNKVRGGCGCGCARRTQSVCCVACAVGQDATRMAWGLAVVFVCGATACCLMHACAAHVHRLGSLQSV
mgnify:CR=1 FL=1